jgi:hypothetical protein
MKEDNGLAIVKPQVTSALAAVEQSKALAEVQASMLFAMGNPRDEVQAERKLMNSCKSLGMADSAAYAFPRGGKMVTGASIRLAEEAARCWGNIKCGFDEIDRGKDFSEVVAYAIDLEANVTFSRKIRIPHTRDKNSGNVELTGERDKYELVANMAQRRVRSCILQIIPAHIIDTALETCDLTLKGGIGDMKEAVTKLLTAFDAVGVTKIEIEGFLQRKLASIVPADIISLRKIYSSIKNGVAAKEEFFREDDVEKMNARFSGNGNRKKKTDSTKTKAAGEKKVIDKPEDATPPAEENGSADDAGTVETPTESPDTAAFEESKETKTVEGPDANGMVACPEAGGMLVPSGECPSLPCYKGCPEHNE